LKKSSSPKKKEEYIYQEIHLYVFMKTTRIDIKEEDLIQNIKPSANIMDPIPPKSMILCGWDVGGKKFLGAFHSLRLHA
jgi:hypothetical protein